VIDKETFLDAYVEDVKCERLTVRRFKSSITIDCETWFGYGVVDEDNEYVGICFSKDHPGTVMRHVVKHNGNGRFEGKCVFYNGRVDPILWIQVEE